MVSEIVSSIRSGEQEDQWSRLLLQTRHISGVQQGSNYNSDTRGRDDDWYGSDDSDNERNFDKSIDNLIQSVNDNKILPMFAALEQGRIDLFLDLVVNPPQNMEAEVYKMSSEESKILVKYIDITGINRSTYSAITSFDF